MAFDVLAEDPFDIGLDGDTSDFWPEMARVVGASLLSGAGEWLAWISGREHMNLATPAAAVEGSKVAPDRSLIQGLVRHPTHESGRCTSFSLDKTNSSISGLGKMEPEFKASDAGAEGDSGKISAGRYFEGM
jgi:hypothetical protein